MAQNRFERHAALWLILCILLALPFCVIIADITLTNTGRALSNLRAYVAQLRGRAPKAEQVRVASDLYHHDLAPNTTDPGQWWGNQMYTLRTNSLGFKDTAIREVSLKSDKRRLVVIGDSFTEGIGVSHEKTFVGILGKVLRSRGFEDVFNAGVSSYSPAIYYRKVKNLLEERGLKFTDLLVMLDLSDIQDETHYQMMDNGVVLARYSNVELLLRRGELRHGRFGHWLKENSTLLGRAYAAFQDWGKDKTLLTYGLDQPRALWTIREELRQEFADIGLVLANKHMTLLHELTRAHGIRMSVAVYPWPSNIYFNDKDSLQVRYWQTWATQHEIPFINLFPPFFDEQNRLDTIQRYFIVGDCHWNEKGHALVADRLAEALR